MNKSNNKIARFYAMIGCGCILGWGCFLVVLRSLLGKSNRQKTNEYLHHNSIRILKIVKTQYRSKGLENFSRTPQKPRIYMSNHLSLFDTPLFYATIPDTIRIVTKKELTKVPLLGKAILNSEHAIVDRHEKGQHQDFYKNAKEKLSTGIALWFFPEGTRSRKGELLPFKMGGFRLACEIGAEIVPVGIVGTNKIAAPGKLLPYLNQSIEIRMGQPIDTTKYTTTELHKELLDKVYNIIRGLITE